MTLSMQNRYHGIHRFPIDLKEVNKARLCLEQEREKREVGPRVLFQISLALDEALTNAIEHGSNSIDKQVELAYRFEDDVVELSIKDHGGIVFNPEYFEQLATIKDWGSGGRGILLIKNYMDEVYFVFSPRRSTRLIMRKSLRE